MRRALVLGSGLLLALGAIGCQDQPTAPPSAVERTGASLRVASPGAGVYGLDRSEIRTPASGRLADADLASAVGRAIDPSDYVCSSTPLIGWLSAEIGRVVTQEPDIFELLYFDLLADLVPTYDALFFETTDTPQYFGYQGQYTKVLLKTERDIKRFWDIPSDDIQLIGMHGTMLLDVERVARVYTVVFGVPPAQATFFATLVHDALLASQTLNGGNHPLFSFNAFAFSQPGGPIPDKIVMGDGVLAGYEVLGFDDVAPQAVYAHEFAHHVQYEKGYFGDPLATTGTQAERTRYTELMADAMAAYYLTHKRGATMNRKRVEQFLEVFFQVGDCGFASPGHHGTPNQRMAATRFGFDVADQAQKQGHILTSEQFHDRFVAAYPTLIAPDAP